MKFTEKDLVDFGNYLLSNNRNIERDKDQVHNEDLQNYYVIKNKIKMAKQPNGDKYSKFKKEDKSGRGHKGAVGFKSDQSYAMGMGPKVGGSVKKTTQALVSPSKKVVKTASKMYKKAGTGSGASKAAKASVKRLR